MIDIGGFTTYWLAVNPGGLMDYSLAYSVSIGIQNVLKHITQPRINYLMLRTELMKLQINL